MEIMKEYFTHFHIKIIIEGISILVLVLIISQSSSLWRRLLVIPFSIRIISLITGPNLLNGLPLLLFIIVFVGGLLTLLVRVASLAKKEQGFCFLKRVFFIFLIRIVPFVLEKERVYFIKNFRFNIFLDREGAILLLSLLVLIVSFFLITNLVFSFKGIIRKL